MIRLCMLGLWLWPCVAGAERVFEAAAFGAVGDGLHDDGPAVLAMLDEAMRAGEPAVLRFAPDRNYHLMTGRDRYALPVAGAADLTIDGGGSRFTVDSSIRFLRLTDSRRIHVGNLRVDYSPLPFADGLLVAKDAAAGMIEVKVDEGFALPPPGGPTKQDGEQAFFAVLWHPGPYSTPEDPYLTREHFFLKEILAGESGSRIVRLVGADPGTAAVIGSAELGRWRCSIPVRGIAHCHGPGPTVLIEKCTDVTFAEVEVWSAPWFAFVVIDNDGTVGFRRVHIRPRPGTTRLTSAWRDGFHVKNNAASLCWDGCILQGMNDDAFNLACHAATVRRMDSPTRIQVVQNYPLGIARMRAGDTLWAYHTGRGVSLGCAKVLRATFNAPVHTVELAEEIPGMEAGKTLVWDADTANPACVIRNCRVDVSSRFRSGVTLENSDFRALCWFTGDDIEAPFPSRVTVRGCGFRTGQGNPSLAVAVAGPNLGGRRPAAPVMWHYRFERNRIAGDFRLEDVGDVVLADNVFTDPRRVIGFRNVTGVRLRGNARGGVPLTSPDSIDTGDSAAEILIER